MRARVTASPAPYRPFLDAGADVVADTPVFRLDGSFVLQQRRRGWNLHTAVYVAARWGRSAVRHDVLLPAPIRLELKPYPPPFFAAEIREPTTKGGVDKTIR